MYILIRLELSRYVRLLLANTTFFCIRPTHHFQCILGTNGSGKSSILRECGPRASSKDDFAENGYKLIEYQIGQSIHTLWSGYTVTGAWKHSYLIDNEEQNPGGTERAQKILIQQHFNITPEIWDIVIGKTKFTQMAALKRRDIIIKMSGMDLDFAMNLFTTLKKSHRDSVAVLKHTNLRLSEEAAKLEDQTEIDRIHNTFKETKQTLATLIEMRDPTRYDIHELRDCLAEQLRKIETLAKSILSSKIPRPEILKQHALTNVNDISNILSGLIAKKDLLQQHLAQLDDAYNKTHEAVMILGGLDDESYQTLQAQTDALRTQLDLITQTITQSVGFDSDLVDSKTSATMSDICGAVMEIVDTLQDNSEGLYTRERRLEAKEQLTSLTKQIDGLRNKQNRYLHAIEHVKKSPLTTCPRCAHAWKDGVNINDHQQMVQAEEDLRKQINDLMQTHERLTDYHQDAVEYATKRQALATVSTSHSQFHRFWKTIATVLETAHPRAVYSVVTQWCEVAEQYTRLAALRNQIEINTHALNNADLIRNSGEVITANRESELVNQIEQTTAGLSEVTDNIRTVKMYQQAIERYNATADDLQRAMQAIIATRDSLIRAEAKHVLQEQILDYQTTVARAELAIQHHKNITAVMRDMETQKAQQTLKEQALGVLHRVISPTDGIIGDVLRKFNDDLLAVMNATIEDVWTYDMRILPCGTEDGQLDFIFPVQSGHKSDDICETSSSQTDIINFAFYLAVVSFMGLNGLPLLFDELGASFDEKHRTQVMLHVKGLIESGFSHQLFMVSHYAAGHGMFAGAEVCVMDSSNLINMPETFNQHVVIR